MPSLYVCVCFYSPGKISREGLTPPTRQKSFLSLSGGIFWNISCVWKFKGEPPDTIEFANKYGEQRGLFFSPLNYLQWELKKKQTQPNQTQKKKMIQNKRQNTFFKQVTRQNLYLWHDAKITPIVTLSCANVKKHIFFFWTEDI